MILNPLTGSSNSVVFDDGPLENGSEEDFCEDLTTIDVDGETLFGLEEDEDRKLKIASSASSIITIEPASRLVYRELVRSEENYVGFLGSFLKIYGAPLSLEASSNQNQVKWVSMEEVDALFHHWSLIEVFHSGTVLPLLSAMGAPNETLINQFIDIFDVLHMLYLHYTLYYDIHGQAVYEKLQQRKMFRQFEKKQNKQARFGQMGFKAFTIMPIQRLPRYLLLFENLLQAEPSNELSLICDRLRNVIKHINDSKRALDDRLGLLKLQQKLSSSSSCLDLDPAMSLSNCGRIIHEGELTLEKIEQVSCITEVILKTVKTEIRVCDQWTSIRLKFTPDQTMYMLDWTEMHVLGLFHLKHLIARSFDPSSILLCYDDQLFLMRSTPDTLEALKQYGRDVLTDRLTVHGIRNFHLDLNPERRVTCDKAYQCILADKLFIMCKSLSLPASSMGEGLKLKRYQKFLYIRRVERVEAKMLCVLIGLTRYLFSGSDDSLNIWIQKFSNLKIPLVAVDSTKDRDLAAVEMEVVALKTPCKSATKIDGWYFVVIGVLGGSMIVFGNGGFLVLLLGIWIGRFHEKK